MKKILTKPILMYTILFFGFFIIATIPSQIRSNTFFGFGLFTDGFKQHLIFMRDFTMHIKDAINGMGFEWFRYDLGLGGDFITSYTYYSLFDPLTFIAYLVPNEAIEFTYYLIAILRLYLCGLVVMWCAKTFQIKHPLALISTAIFYVFNVTVIYSALRHPMFVNGPLLFPLIIIGAERLFRHQNPALLIVGSFLSLITQFYFFMFVCVGFELFVIIRLLIEKKDKTWKEIFTHFFYVNIMYLLGALCAGFILFPQFIATLNSGRIAGKGIIFYDALDYTIFFASYLVPVIGGHYTSAIGNIVVFFIVIAYIRIRPKTWESILFLVLSGMMLLSVFGYMFNLFSYVNNRWTFLMMLPTAMILGKTIDQPDIITKSAVSKASQVTYFILVLIGAYGIVYAASLLNQTIITLAAIGIAIIGVLLLYRIIFKKPIGENLIQHFTQTKLVRLTLITSFAVVAIIASVYFFTMTSSAGLSSYEDEETFALIHEDTSYYRVEQKVYALGTNYLANDNLVGGYNSTYSYNTMGNGYVNQVISYYDVVNLNSTAGYNGFNNRSALMGINHVKYVIIRDSEATPVPYGFTLIGTTQVKKTIPDQYNMVDIGYLELENGEVTYENAFIYRNDSFIPFGFVYHEVITKADLEALNPLEREQILLKAALVEEDVVLPTHTPTASIEEATPTLISQDGITMEQNSFVSTKKDAKLTFQVTGATNHEVYVWIENFQSMTPDKEFTITYETPTSKVPEATYGKGTNFDFDNPNHLVNLGYTQTDEVTITMTFPKGTYTFDAFKVLLNPMDDYDAQVMSLNANHLQNLTFNSRGFTGTLHLEEAGLLFISLPYHEGFRAYSNDVEQKIIHTNVGYMGLLLEAGDHTIRMEYHTPGLQFGVIVSLVAIAIAIITAMIIGFYQKYHEKGTFLKGYFQKYFSSNYFLTVTYIISLISWVENIPILCMAHCSLMAILIILTQSDRIHIGTLILSALIIPRSDAYNTNVYIYFGTVALATPFIFYDIFKSKHRFREPLFYAMLALLIANALSLINVKKDEFYNSFMGAFIFFAYFYAYWYLKSTSKPKGDDTILKNSFALGMALTFQFVYYILTYEGQIIGKDIDFNWAQSNGIAMMALFLIPLNIGLYIKHQKHNFILLGVIGEVVVLFLTLSKGAYVSLALISIPTFIITWLYAPNRKKLLADLFLSLLLIGVIAWGITRIDKVSVGITQYLEAMDARGWFNDPVRLEIYNKGLEVFKEFPLFGRGTNTTVPGLSYRCSHYHNFIIHTLATTGILGALAFGFYLISMVFTCIKKNPYHLMVLMSVLAMMIHGLFDNAWYKPLVMVATSIVISQLEDPVIHLNSITKKLTQ